MQRTSKGTPVPTIGLEEYAHTLFVVVTHGDSIGSVYDDPADAIADAEELTACSEQDFYVLAVRVTDDPPVHRARAKRRRTKRASRSEGTARKEGT